MTETDLLIQNLKREIKRLQEDAYPSEEVSHWKKVNCIPDWENGRKIEYYECERCTYTISDRYGLYRYCPDCGAKMERGMIDVD